MMHMVITRALKLVSLSLERFTEKLPFVKGQGCGGIAIHTTGSTIE